MFQNISNSIYFSFHFYPCSFYSHTQPLCVSLKGYSTLLFKWTKIFEWKKDVLKKGTILSKSDYHHLFQWETVRKAFQMIFDSFCRIFIFKRLTDLYLHEINIHLATS